MKRPLLICLAALGLLAFLSAASWGGTYVCLDDKGNQVACVPKTPKVEKKSQALGKGFRTSDKPAGRPFGHRKDKKQYPPKE